MNNKLPFVSIATATFNRRPFIPYLIKCIEQQDYKGNIEWVIIDDGIDKIEDLVISIKNVKYFKYENRLKLGKKRNILNKKCSGDIIIYFDDDDYYPPQRISHAVDVLLKNPNYMIAGSSLMHVYYKHINKMYSFGPYGKYHSTAATFAFRKELLNETEFNDDDCISEELYFLKNYKIPLIQLDTNKTILVFSHIHNSFDKKDLLDESNGNTLKKLSSLNVDDFIKDPVLKNFYSNDMDSLLLSYEYGDINYKPDIIEKIKNTKEERKRIIRENNEKQKEYNNLILNSKKPNPKNLYKNNDNNETNNSNETNIQINNIKQNNDDFFSKEYVEELKKYYEKTIEEKTFLINNLMIKLKQLQKQK